MKQGELCLVTGATAAVGMTFVEEGLRGLSELVAAGKQEDGALREAIRRLVPEFSGTGAVAASQR